MATLLELQNAGLPALTTDGGVHASFSRPLTDVENLLFLSMVNVEEYRKLQGREDFGDLPNWGTWTQAQWDTYFSANISSAQVAAIANLADAKVVLGKMSTVLNNQAKAIIALRNRVFPDL
jgi:hypothetical protein